MSEFNFPPGASAPIAERVNRLIARSASRDQLLPYCFVIDTFVRGEEPPWKRRLRTPAALLGRLASSLPLRGSSVRWKGDVILAGECSGTVDTSMMTRLIEGISRTGRSVLYLATTRREADALRISTPPLARGVTILEIESPTQLPQYLLNGDAQQQLAADVGALEPILRQAEAWLWDDAIAPMRGVAVAKSMWRNLGSRLDAPAVAVRTNYLPLSAAMLAGAGDQLTVAFQHSLVTAPASFVPIPSRRFVAFGRTSKELLMRLDSGAGAPRCREIVPAGSLLDPIVARDPSRESRRILIIDSGEGFAPRFLGATEQYEALIEAVRLLSHDPTLEVVVRPHPRGGAGGWKRLARHLDGAFKLSTGPSLTDDLASASIVAGLFSTVLPVAAASGIPTLFLWKEGWFFTPDLDPFVEGHFVRPADLSARVGTLLSSAAAFETAAESSLRAGGAYFEGGRRCEFDEPFIESIFRAL